MTKLERNAKLLVVLGHLSYAYQTGDFSSFVTLLTEDCIYESMWVRDPLCGKEAVSQHLLGKGKSIEKSGTFPSCWIVELIGDMNLLPGSNVIVNGEKNHATIALAYEPGKYCLMMEQKLNGKTNGVLVDLKLNDEGLVCRMDLCMPELFKIRDFGHYISVYPTNTEDDYDEDDDKEIYISEAYFKELYAFFCVAGEEFDEDVGITIPMDKWQKVLAAWEEFATATDYDTIVEKLCGINYTTEPIANKDALDYFDWCGWHLWSVRKAHSMMVRDLMEWTQKYQDQYRFIQIYGYVCR